MEDLQTKKFIVFYSWQSDLPKKTNISLIRNALGEASSSLNNDFTEENVHIVVDEAVQERSGSPNIALTIFEKIQSADAFLCDITTIGFVLPKDEESSLRPVPNPNVMIELGYAIAYLGWERIILLFNTSYGEIDHDVPFDIRGHRILHYEFSIDMEKNKGQENRKQLVRDIHTALKAIISKCPEKTTGKQPTLGEKKRRHDIATMKSLLSKIHVPTLDSHVGEAPYKIYYRTTFFWENFHGFVSNSLFHLYDMKLKMLVSRIHTAWGVTLSYHQHYTATHEGDCFFFRNFDESPLTIDQKQDWKTIATALSELQSAFQELVSIVREQYLEIDLAEMSNQAWHYYVNYKKP